MTGPFIHDDFLLETDASIQLYHQYAEGMPIIDYHSHLPAGEIAQNAKFENIAGAWLGHDHYKWRLMRWNGIDESYITGGAPDYDKFIKWAETIPKAIGNPIYHWTQLELARFFGIETLLGPDTMEEIWEKCNQTLDGNELSCRKILERMNVEIACTTNDPTDPLESHRKIAADPGMKTRVLPAFRPDKAMAIENPADFKSWIKRLEKAADTDVRNLDSFLSAIKNRYHAFHNAGCRLSDHGMNTIHADDYTENEVNGIFLKALNGNTPDDPEIAKFRSFMLYTLAKMNHKMGWVQQLHVGALRNNNTRMFRLLGPDSGFDSIGDFRYARPLSRILDKLDRDENLTRTILYNHNPIDNEMTATMAGNFQDGKTPGKIQFGAAWWFMDQKEGIETQINVLSHMGLLSRFIGMTTDSRSFLSYTRHEYFRRILCNNLGRNIKKGLIPRDMELVGGMVRDICYHNALNYFNF